MENHLKTNNKVLILDGETRSALATTRSLGNNGYLCFVASHEFPSLAGSSKYCFSTLKYPSIKESPSKFKSWLIEVLNKFNFDYLLSISDSSLREVIECKDLLPKNLILPFPSLKSINLTHDKFSIMELANSFGIQIPKTILIPKNYDNSNFGDDLINKLGLPIVFKARSSIQVTNLNTQEKPPLKYAKDPSEVISFLKSKLPNKFEYIAQEHIVGEGSGLFILIKNNKTIASFAHRRILEKPPEGGVSVLSESIEINPDLLKKSENLLKSLLWEGVAMLEFKHLNGENFLMEINPRLWGSLQLAIDSGIDFPNLLLKNNPETILTNSHKLNKRLRWELGLLDHTLIQLKRDPINFIKAIFIENRLGFLKKKTKNEIFRIDDIKPFYFEIINYFKRHK